MKVPKYSKKFNGITTKTLIISFLEEKPKQMSSFALVDTANDF